MVGLEGPDRSQSPGMGFKVLKDHRLGTLGRCGGLEGVGEDGLGGL